MFLLEWSHFLNSIPDLIFQSLNRRVYFEIRNKHIIRNYIFHNLISYTKLKKLPKVSF